MSATDESAARWVSGLPIRWGLGGLALGFVWSFGSSVAQGSFSNPAGGLTAALVRVGSIIVLPLGVLGFMWGSAERYRLTRYAAKGREQLILAMRRNVLRQTCIAIICGALFWLLYEILPPGSGSLLIFPALSEVCC
jgi:hypothetical protein